MLINIPTGQAARLGAERTQRRQKEPKGGMKGKDGRVVTGRAGLQGEGTGMESGVLNT